MKIFEMKLEWGKRIPRSGEISELTRLREKWNESGRKVPAEIPKKKVPPKGTSGKPSRKDRKAKGNLDRIVNNWSAPDLEKWRNRDDDEKREWARDLAYREGFWAGYSFFDNPSPPSIPEAGRLGIQLEIEDLFREGLRDGFKQRKEDAKLQKGE